MSEMTPGSPSRKGSTSSGRAKSPLPRTNRNYFLPTAATWTPKVGECVALKDLTKAGILVDVEGDEKKIEYWDGSTFTAKFKITGSKMAKLKGATEAEVRRELSLLQIERCEPPRPTVKSTVRIVSGTYKGRAGEIVEDKVESVTPFTVHDWNGSPLRGIATKEVEGIKRAQMADLQMKQWKRPTAGAFVELQHDMLAGKITDDAKDAEAPYEIQWWDGTKLEARVRTDAVREISRQKMAEKQISATSWPPRPTLDSTVKVTQGEHQGRAGMVAADDTSAEQCFTLEDWKKETFGPFAANEVSTCSADELAQLQVISGERPTVGYAVEFVSGPYAGRAGVICEDAPDKDVDAPFSLQDWTGEILTHLQTDQVRCIHLERMANIQIQSSPVKRPTVGSTVEAKVNGHIVAAEISIDNKASKTPFTLKGWDGKVVMGTESGIATEQVKPIARADMAHTQIRDDEYHGGVRPTMGIAVKTVDGSAAGIISADKHEEMKCFKLMGWNKGFTLGPFSSAEVEVVSLADVVDVQIRTGRPTQGNMIKITGGSLKHMNKAGVIMKDVKPEENDKSLPSAPFSIADWNGDEIIGLCVENVSVVNTRREMAMIQVCVCVLLRRERGHGRTTHDESTSCDADCRERIVELPLSRFPMVIISCRLMCLCAGGLS